MSILLQREEDVADRPIHTEGLVSHPLPREVGVLRVLQHPLACSPIKGGAGGAVLKNK